MYTVACIYMDVHNRLKKYMLASYRLNAILLKCDYDKYHHFNIAIHTFKVFYFFQNLFLSWHFRVWSEMPANRVSEYDTNSFACTCRYLVNPDQTLQIHYVTAQDAGKYTCTAVNDVGVVTASAQLLVEGKTEILLHYRRVFSWQFDRRLADTVGAQLDCSLHPISINKQVRQGVWFNLFAAALAVEKNN